MTRVRRGCHVRCAHVEFDGAIPGEIVKQGPKIVLIGALVAGLAVLSTLPAAAQSSSEKPQATEVGVTASEIHIAIVADVDNPLAPGLFKGAEDGVNAGVAYVNSKAGGGGIAGRKLVADFYDSHLNASETRNATISACQNDLAMVGGIVLFLTSVEDIVNCKDKTGQAVGIPDMASTNIGIPETCAPTSYPAIGASTDCTTVTANPQTYYGNQGEAKWLLAQHKGGLHGPMFIGNDTKDSARGGTILALADQQAGIKADGGTTVGRGGRDPQSAYTVNVQQMKTDGSNFSQSALAPSGTLELRDEANLQGLDNSKIVWDNVSSTGTRSSPTTRRRSRANTRGWASCRSRRASTTRRWPHS